MAMETYQVICLVLAGGVLVTYMLRRRSRLHREQ
jgi:hypothetical protein